MSAAGETGLSGIPVSVDYQMELDRHFAWFENKLPARPARFVNWLRQPSSRLVRIPLAVLLILGGIFSILPVLGLWMLPLGLLLFAQDVPVLRPPLVRLLAWVERKWSERQRKKAQ
ncbi:MAG: hypothetical protein GY844_34315 [Bradyrhizobium sp.]|nr:hypothetical protein [Bradyrhizobium sp.]